MAALQILAMPLGIAVVCALPSGQIHRFHHVPKPPRRSTRLGVQGVSWPRCAVPGQGLSAASLRLAHTGQLKRATTWICRPSDSDSAIGVASGERKRSTSAPTLLPSSVGRLCLRSAAPLVPNCSSAPQLAPTSSPAPWCASASRGGRPTRPAHPACCRAGQAWARPRGVRSATPMRDTPGAAQQSRDCSIASTWASVNLKPAAMGRSDSSPQSAPSGSTAHRRWVTARLA